MKRNEVKMTFARTNPSVETEALKNGSVFKIRWSVSTQCNSMCYACLWSGSEKNACVKLLLFVNQGFCFNNEK